MFDLLMLPVNVCLRVTLSMNLLWMHYSNRWLYWDWFWSEQIGVTAVSLYRHALCIFPRLIPLPSSIEILESKIS